MSISIRDRNRTIAHLLWTTWMYFRTPCVTNSLYEKRVGASGAG